MKKLYLCSLLFMLPHCANIKKKKIFEPVQIQSDKRIGVKPDWHFKKDILYIDKLIEDGLSEQQAIAMALDNNDMLQSQFEEIGIRKSDLIQAGFYSNPYVETIFRIPLQSDSQTNIQFNASFSLSDLWQVPLRKKVAQDELEIKTYEIINAVLSLRAHVQKAYLDILYHQELVLLTKEIIEWLTALRDRIYYRYQFGYNSDLDKYIANSRLAEWQANIIEQEVLLTQSYVQLHQLLGGHITNASIILTNTLTLNNTVPALENLEKSAFEFHPKILIEQNKINRANHSISYEQSRVIDNVQIGVTYERDLEKNQSGVGPLFGINIPLFNTNYGNIERARFELKQAEKMLVAQQRLIQQAVIKHATQYEAYIKQINLYQNQVIPPALKAIEYSKTYFDRMQMDIIVFLDANISLYNYKLMLLELTYKAALEYIDLELAVGSQIKTS